MKKRCAKHCGMLVLALAGLAACSGGGSGGYGAGSGGSAGSASVNVLIPSVPAGTMVTLAGNGTNGYAGDKGAAANAELYWPYGVAVDASGNLYIADMENNVVRKVSAATGNITTIAGSGAHGCSGDNGAATSALLFSPEAIAVDTGGNLYIADSECNRIRKVNAATGIITTVAGNGNGNYSGDNVAATASSLSYPAGVAVDANGNLYIADSSNNRVRMVSAATGIISTVAGTGAGSNSPLNTPLGGGYTGDGGPATSAELHAPSAVAVDAAGNLYIADAGNNVIRKVSAATGIITTVAGKGVAGYSGDNGPAASAELDNPNGIAVDAGGNLYIGDSFNNVVRKVNAATGIIITVAGNGTGAGSALGGNLLTGGFSGDHGPATSAELFFPWGVTVDASGNLYIADIENNRVRMVAGN